jgi:geranylgeranyl diphosphate synthase, type II
MIELERHIAQFEAYLKANPFEGKPDSLYAPMNYIMQLGGKRIRPALVLMGAEIGSGKAEAALPIALAVETFHNFSLVHDDIMDAAPVRRGKPTVHIQWNEPTAILAGDNLLVEAVHLVAKHGDREGKALRFFLQTAREVCEGQQMDMDFQARNDVSEIEYLAMIRLKTAVLLGCAMYCGAISGGADDAIAGLLYDFAVNAGMGFQMQDDFLDAFGDPQETGKQCGGDILADKKTLLWLYMWQHANEAQRREIIRLSGYCAPEAEAGKIDTIKRMMQATGADKHIVELSRASFSDAALCLQTLDNMGANTAGPKELLVFLSGRRH